MTMKTSTAAATVAILITLVGGAAPASARETADHLDQARDFLADYGVDDATQGRLIASYLAGERWDSFDSDSSPVQSTTRELPGVVQTIARYEDGSVSVTSIERPQEQTTGEADSSPAGCTADGDERNNCTVDTWVGLIQLSFKASYNVATDTVTNVYGAGWQIGGACSSSLVYLGIPATDMGRLDVSAQMCGAPYNSTFFLAVTVDGGVATESWG